MPKPITTKKPTQTSLILDLLRERGCEMSPTQIGTALGYEYVDAASRVAKSLRFLCTSGEIVRNQIAHNKVTYRIA